MFLDYITMLKGFQYCDENQKNFKKLQKSAREERRFFFPRQKITSVFIYHGFFYGILPVLSRSIFRTKKFPCTYFTDFEQLILSTKIFHWLFSRISGGRYFSVSRVGRHINEYPWYNVLQICSEFYS